MKRLLAILAGVLLAASASSAQPPGPPPTLQVVSKTNPGKGLIVFVRYEAVNEQVAVKVLVNINGQNVEETRLVTRVVYRTVEYSVDISNGRVITPDGKQLPIDEAWKRLKAKTVVAVSADGNTPAADYLRALSAETLVIIPGPAKLEPPSPPKKMPR